MVANEPKYEHISDKLKDLIRLMLTPNPLKRPSIWDVEILIESFNSIKEI